MSHLFLYIFVAIVLSAFSSAGQKTWDGQGQNGLWSDPLNWSQDIIPLEHEDIVLDNSLLSGRYRVQLPDATIRVRSILINPRPGDSIELVLPASNTAVPGLIVSGTGYGIDIHDRGIFRNASGAASGTPLQVTDSIRILSGGRFIHNTPAGHAAHTMQLSTAGGTEKGILEFDIPDPSTTLSLSGRTFGKLVLSASAAGGTLNYTAAGTNGVLVRSDLQINTGVRFNLNFSDTLRINGDLLQYGGSTDLGTTARSLVVSVAGGIYLAPSAAVLETGSGFPKIELSGIDRQEINIQGQLSGAICFSLNKSGEAVLISSLTLPHRLELLQGSLKTSEAAMLNLDTDCSIQADTVSALSYVDGPLRKSELNHEGFLFPVGKDNIMRWVRLENATGSFIVEYFRSNPYALSQTLGPGIDHISGVEYWSIQALDHAGSTATPKFSFLHPHSGGVTDLSALRVSRLVSGTWQDAGNNSFGGNAGSNGWVGSFPASGFSAESNIFALASAIGQENPLPFFDFSLNTYSTNRSIRLDWKMSTDVLLQYFQVFYSTDNRVFELLHTQASQPGIENYTYTISHMRSEKLFFRINAIDVLDRTVFRSRTILVLNKPSTNLSFWTSGVADDHLQVFLTTQKRVALYLCVVDSRGAVLQRVDRYFFEGYTAFEINTGRLPKGMYFLYGTDGTQRTATVRFIRR